MIVSNAFLSSTKESSLPLYKEVRKLSKFNFTSIPMKTISVYFISLLMFCVAEKAKLQKRGLSEYATQELNPIFHQKFLPFNFDFKETTFTEFEDLLHFEAIDKKQSHLPILNAKQFSFLQNKLLFYNQDHELLTHAEAYQPLSIISHTYPTLPQSHDHVLPQLYQLLIEQYLKNDESKNIKPIVEEIQE